MQGKVALRLSVMGFQSACRCKLVTLNFRWLTLCAFLKVAVSQVKLLAVDHYLYIFVLKCKFNAATHSPRNIFAASAQSFFQQSESSAEGNLPPALTTNLHARRNSARFMESFGTDGSCFARPHTFRSADFSRPLSLNKVLAATALSNPFLGFADSKRAVCPASGVASAFAAARSCSMCNLPYMPTSGPPSAVDRSDAEFIDSPFVSCFPIATPDNIVDASTALSTVGTKGTPGETVGRCALDAVGGGAAAAGETPDFTPTP